MKKILAILIIIITFVVFGYYLATHPELLKTVTNLSLLTIVGLTLGYIGMIVINAFILHWSLQFVKHRLNYSENLLLTGYSSIVNFFGPLQSGPGFRALYLKKRHDVKLREFFVTLLIFYIFFAIINGGILLFAVIDKFGSGNVYGLIGVGILGLGIGTRIMIARSAKLRDAISRIKLNDPQLWKMGFGALISILITGLIYYTELLQVAPATTAYQAMIYTAAANFALFVALTPGAIGFRESFILLSQQLHGIEANAIIGANVIDRAFYVVFLLVLFIILVTYNSKRHLSVFDIKKE